MPSGLSSRLTALDARARVGVLGVGRIVLALCWLANLHWKVPGAFGQDTGGGLYKYVESVTRNSPFAPFTWVVEEIILPNYRAFGWFNLVTETIVAMLLLIGYRTKVVALIGAAMVVPIMLSVLYYDRADEWSWSYLLFFAAHLLVYAADAGQAWGLDGVLRRGASAGVARGTTIVGAVAIVVGLAGLFVARSVDFAGDKVALLGSDAGFVNSDGSVTRRWELKFLFFNPLWALLTVAGGVLLVMGARKLVVLWLAGGWFAAMAVVVFVLGTFDYQRDDGVGQTISTGTNVALWGAFAVAALAIAHRRQHRSAA